MRFSTLSTLAWGMPILRLAGRQAPRSVHDCSYYSVNVNVDWSGVERPPSSNSNFDIRFICKSWNLPSSV